MIRFDCPACGGCSESPDGDPRPASRCPRCGPPSPASAAPGPSHRSDPSDRQVMAILVGFAAAHLLLAAAAWSLFVRWQGSAGRAIAAASGTQPAPSWAGTGGFLLTTSVASILGVAAVTVVFKLARRARAALSRG